MDHNTTTREGIKASSPADEEEMSFKAKPLNISALSIQWLYNSVGTVQQWF